jgi:hypothetical protein
MTTFTLAPLKRLLAWSSVCDLRLELARVKKREDDGRSAKVTHVYATVCRGCLLDAPDRTVDRIMATPDEVDKHLDDHRAQHHRVPEPGAGNAAKLAREFLS